MFRFVADARQMTGLLPPSPSSAGLENDVMRNTTMKVQGICCASEIPLINKLLNNLPGVTNISVSVTTRTVIVAHDISLTSAPDLVRTLNSAGPSKRVLVSASASLLTPSVNA